MGVRELNQFLFSVVLLLYMCWKMKYNVKLISKTFLVSSSTPQTLAPGCLAHPRDPPTQALLCSMITKRQKVSVLKEDVTRL